MKCTNVLLIVALSSNVRAGLKWQQYPLETATVSDYTNSTDEPPSPRAHAAISYVTSMQFFAIFGGQAADGSAMDDTFVLDAVASKWVIFPYALLILRLSGHLRSLFHRATGLEVNSV